MLGRNIWRDSVRRRCKKGVSVVRICNSLTVSLKLVVQSTNNNELSSSHFSANSSLQRKYFSFFRNAKRETH